MLSTSLSPYFQLHKMLCSSFIRPYCKSDPPCNILCENCLFGMSGVLFLKSQWFLKKNFNVHYVLSWHFYMTFSEAKRKFNIFHTSHKKELNNISWGCVTLQFYWKISSKISLWLQIFSQLQKNYKNYFKK